MPHTPRSFTRLAAATLLAVGLGLVSSLPATASAIPSTDQAPITWSMTPLPDESQSPQPWVELSLEPGQTVQRQLVVKNHSTQAATFGLQAADGYFTNTGRFNMLASDEPSTAAGTWITIQDEVTVGPKSSETVSFKVTVPDNATPGDHAAGVASAITSVGQSPDGASVGLESRIGFRVMTRVEGELHPALAVEDIDASYTQSWNPFSPGEISVDFALSNTGNVQLDPGSQLSSFMNSQAPTTDNGSLLPGDQSRISLTLDSSWPIFLTPATLKITGTDQAQTEQVVLTDRIWVWTLPLPQLLVLVGVTLCLVGMRRRKATQRQRFEQLLEQAKREAAAEVRLATQESDV